MRLISGDTSDETHFVSHCDKDIRGIHHTYPSQPLYNTLHEVLWSITRVHFIFPGEDHLGLRKSMTLVNFTFFRSVDFGIAVFVVAVDNFNERTTDATTVIVACNFQSCILNIALQVARKIVLRKMAFILSKT